MDLGVGKLHRQPIARGEVYGIGWVVLHRVGVMCARCVRIASFRVGCVCVRIKWGMRRQGGAGS